MHMYVFKSAKVFTNKMIRTPHRKFPTLQHVYNMHVHVYCIHSSTVCKLTSIMGDQSLHDFKSVEPGSVVDSSKAVCIYGIDQPYLARLGQVLEVILHELLSSVSGSLHQAERRGERGKGGTSRQRASI